MTDQEEDDFIHQLCFEIGAVWRWKVARCHQCALILPKPIGWLDFYLSLKEVETPSHCVFLTVNIGQLLIVDLYDPESLTKVKSLLATIISEYKRIQVLDVAVRSGFRKVEMQE